MLSLGQGQSTKCLIGAVAKFRHADRIAAGAEVDLGHVIAHEHEPPATRALEVFNGGGVGDVGGGGGAALVADMGGGEVTIGQVGDARFLFSIKIGALLDVGCER